MKFRAQSFNFSILIFLCLAFVQANAQSQKNKSSKVALPTTQARFISGNSSLEIPFELSNNLVLLQAKINDSAPFWFMFDTGAESTVIDTELAKMLRLKPNGKIIGNGATASAITAVRFKPVSLRLPNVEISNLTTYGLPLDSLSAPLGKKIGGIIGYDFIKEFVVEIDFANRKINLYKPESYRYSGAGEIFPLMFEENLPFVRATAAFEKRLPINGKFEIDSGLPDAILFNTPFVKKHRLLRAVSQKNETRIGGVGSGTGQTFLGRVKGIALG